MKTFHIQTHNSDCLGSLCSVYLDSFQGFPALLRRPHAGAQRLHNLPMRLNEVSKTHGGRP